MGGGIVTALVLAMWMMWPASPAPSAAVPAAPRRVAPSRRPKPGAIAPVAPVKLDALTASAQGPSEQRTEPVSLSAESGTAAAASRWRCRRQTVTEAPEPPVPTGPPPPPPIPLKFIGILERANGVKWAVLSDGKVTMHGRDGDIIDGRYGS